MVKEDANLYPLPEDQARDIETREDDRLKLWEALRRAGFSVPDPMPATLSSEMVRMIYQFLGRTPSQLLMVQLEDLLGELDTPNLPGAPDSVYPSWRVRLCRPMSSWLKDPANTDFSRLVCRERRSRTVSALTSSRKK